MIKPFICQVLRFVSAEMWTQRAQELLLPHLRNLLKVSGAETMASVVPATRAPHLNQNRKLSPGQRTCPPQTRLTFPHLLPSASHMAPPPWDTGLSSPSVNSYFVLQDLHVAFPQDMQLWCLFLAETSACSG